MLLLPVRHAAAASRTCAVTLSGKWCWSGTHPSDMGCCPICMFSTGWIAGLKVAGGSWPVTDYNMGSTAVGWGGSAPGGINLKARCSSIQAKIRLSLLSVTASDTVGWGGGGGQALMLLCWMPISVLPAVSPGPPRLKLCVLVASA